MKPLRYLALTCAWLLASVLGVAQIVSAEQPGPVISALSTDGVFVHSSRENNIDRQRLADVVESADEFGIRMAIIVPADPLPDLRAFVLRVQQGGEFDVVLGFGLDGEIEAEAIDDLGSDRLSALTATRALDGSPEELSAVFLEELATNPPTGLPNSMRTIIRWVIILLGLLGLTVVVEQIVRSRSKRGQPAA